MKKGIILSIAAAGASILATILGLVDNSVNKKEKQAWEAEQIDKSVLKHLSENYSLKPKTEV